LIYQLMKLDRAWKFVPVFAGAAVILAFLLSFIVSILESPGSDPIPYFPLGTLLFLPLMDILLLFCRAHERAAAYSISLPVSGRAIFLARMLSILSVLWIPAILYSMILSVHGLKPMDVLAGASLATLSIFSLQSFHIREWEVPRNSISRLFIVVPIFILPLNLLWRFPMEHIFVLCLLASAALFMVIWKNIPASFQITTMEIASPEMVEKEAKIVKRPARFIFPARIWLVICLPLLSTIVTLMLFIFIRIDDFSFFFLFTNFIMYITMTWPALNHGMGWLWTLPVSRRKILPFYILPLLLSAVAGYAVLAYVHGWGGDIEIYRTQVLPPTIYKSDQKVHNVIPPLEFWKQAHEGAAAIIKAPWGETFQPPIVKLLGLHIYNPYAAGGENSHHFFEWQLERASIAVYGHSYSFEDVAYSNKMRHLSPPPLRIQIIHNAGNMAIMLFIIGYIELFYWGRLRQFRRLFRIIGIAIPACLYVSIPFSLELFSKIVWYCKSLPVILSWCLPDNSFTMAGIVAAVLALLYFCCDKLFCEAEAPADFWFNRILKLYI
jgi:hypothetical protein